MIEFFSTCFSLLERYPMFFVEGVMNTLVLAFFSVIFGTVLGTFIVMLKMSPFKILRFLANAYIEIIRGTPLLIQLTFIFYGAPMIGIVFPDVAFIPGFQRLAAGIFAMSINSAAYVAEIIRAGIQAVDKGQTEAARSLGFKPNQTMQLVVLPQAIRNILPALGNEFVTVIKESSVVSLIGVAELTFRTSDIRAITYLQLEPLFIAAVIYFILTFTTTRLLGIAEQKMNNETRERKGKNVRN